MKRLLVKNFTLLFAIFAMTGLYASDFECGSDVDELADEMMGCSKQKRATTKEPLKEKECEQAPKKWHMEVKSGVASFKNDAGLCVALNKCHEIEIDGVGCIGYAKREVVQAVNLGMLVLKLNEQFEKDVEHLMAKYDKCECKDESHKEGCHKHKK